MGLTSRPGAMPANVTRPASRRVVVGQREQHDGDADHRAGDPAQGHAQQDQPQGRDGQQGAVGTIERGFGHRRGRYQTATLRRDEANLARHFKVLAAGGALRIDPGFSYEGESAGDRGGLRAASRPELAQDVRDVDARRLFADEERLRDLPVGSPRRHELQNLAFPRGQPKADGRRTLRCGPTPLPMAGGLDPVYPVRFVTAPMTLQADQLVGSVRVNRTRIASSWELFVTGIASDGGRDVIAEFGGSNSNFNGSAWDWLAAP